MIYFILFVTTILSLVAICSSVALWFLYLGLTGMMKEQADSLIDCWTCIKDMAEGLMKDQLTSQMYDKFSGNFGKRSH